jgi:hypothetical protein
LKRGRALLATVLALACGGTQGCFWHRKPQPTVQTPPVPQPPAPSSSSSKPKARSTAKTAHRAHHSTKAASRVKTPPAPAAVVGPPPPATPVGPPAPPPPPVDPAPLAEMLTPDEKADLRRALDRSLSSVRRNLSELSTQTLSPQQAETANLVRAFVSQAERARETDLTTAAQLARRAELLARSLVAGH